MILKEQLIDYSTHGKKKNICLFTANGVLDKQGKLVMGAGNALAVKNTFKTSNEVYGQELKDNYHKDSNGVYTFNLITNEKLPWAFQTKFHWKDESDLELIKISIEHLKAYALIEPNTKFHLPAPGCGHGGLKYKDIEPLIKNLPDNVYVYYVNPYMEDDEVECEIVDRQIKSIETDIEL